MMQRTPTLYTRGKSVEKHATAVSINTMKGTTTTNVTHIVLAKDLHQ
jgi:hypothetical protein